MLGKSLIVYSSLLINIVIISPQLLAMDAHTAYYAYNLSQLQSIMASVE